MIVPMMLAGIPIRDPDVLEERSDERPSRVWFFKQAERS